MFVKICGITNIEDAMSAIESGASALGFIFAPSKRQITADKAAYIVKHLPPGIIKVGVFVNETNAKILRVANQVSLSCIQLHGSESPEQCDELKGPYPLIKALKMSPAGYLKSESHFNVWKLLIDTYIANVEGGSGVSFDWRVLRQFDPKKIIVAGGITPENVGELLSICQPYGIDLSSGVEQYPGKKDVSKLKKLFLQIHNSEGTQHESI